ncbi:MAG: hypothetical protein RLZZ324_629 [Candidatus Parcubacteria bacterium]|jgi:hypothetical protein
MFFEDTRTDNMYKKTPGYGGQAFSFWPTADVTTHTVL